MRTITTIAATGIAALLAFTAQAQTDPTRESTPATPLSTTLGLVVFPAKNQSKDQQATDETECYAWSKQQTGIDPFAAPTSAPAQTAAAAEEKQGGEQAAADQKAMFNKGFSACLEARAYTVK